MKLKFDSNRDSQKNLIPPDQPENERLTKQLRQHYEHPATGLYTEFVLAEAGLLKNLEQSGVLPAVQNPNPYNPIAQPAEHDEWWREHPNQGAAFIQDMEKRESVLKHLYIGSLLTKTNST